MYLNYIRLSKKLKICIVIYQQAITLGGQVRNISSFSSFLCNFFEFLLNFQSLSSSILFSGWATRPPGKALPSPLRPISVFLKFFIKILFLLISLFSLWLKCFLIERSSMMLSDSLSSFVLGAGGSNQLGLIRPYCASSCLSYVSSYCLCFVFCRCHHSSSNLSRGHSCLFIACAFNMAPQSDGPLSPIVIVKQHDLVLHYKSISRSVLFRRWVDLKH